MTTILYQIFDRQGRLATKEKSFASEEAMQKWVARQEETNSNWAGVLAFSD